MGLSGQQGQRLCGTNGVPRSLLCSEGDLSGMSSESGDVVGVGSNRPGTADGPRTADGPQTDGGTHTGGTAQVGIDSGATVLTGPGTQPSVSRRKTGVALLSVVSNTTLIILKLIVGLLIGSVAVISEAIHSGVDLVASLIALVAVRKSSEAADERHPYGHGKFENISAAVEALLIFGAAAWIIYEAVGRLIHPKEIEMPGWGVAVMGLSAVANVIVSGRLFKVARETDSMALQADAWHLRTDVYTSAGVTVGLLVILSGRYLWPGVDLHWIDAVIAIIVALLILKAAVELTRDAVRDLLDVSLPTEDVEWIPEFVAKTWPQVKGFHNLRSRKAGPTRFLDFHLVVDERMPVSQAHALGDEIVVAIKERLPDSRVNIHIEPCDYHCPPSCEAGCSVDKEGRGAGSDR
jgi:cation diffusion facilitator family transporter